MTDPSRDWRDHDDLLAEIVRLTEERDRRLRVLANDRPDGFVADSSKACASPARATPAEVYARLRAVQYVHERLANAYRELAKRIHRPTSLNGGARSGGNTP